MQPDLIPQRGGRDALSLRNCLVSSNDLLRETEAIISLNPSLKVVRPSRISALISSRRFLPKPSSSVAQSFESRVVIVPSNWKNTEIGISSSRGKRGTTHVGEDDERAVGVRNDGRDGRHGAKELVGKQPAKSRKCEGHSFSFERISRSLLGSGLA